MAEKLQSIPTDRGDMLKQLERSVLAPGEQLTLPDATFYQALLTAINRQPREVREALVRDVQGLIDKETINVGAVLTTGVFRGLTVKRWIGGVAHASVYIAENSEGKKTILRTPKSSEFKKQLDTEYRCLVDMASKLKEYARLFPEIRGYDKDHYSLPVLGETFIEGVGLDKVLERTQAQGKPQMVETEVALMLVKLFAVSRLLHKPDNAAISEALEADFQANRIHIREGRLEGIVDFSTITCALGKEESVKRNCESLHSWILILVGMEKAIKPPWSDFLHILEERKVDGQPVGTLADLEGYFGQNVLKAIMFQSSELH